MNTEYVTIWSRAKSSPRPYWLVERSYSKPYAVGIFGETSGEETEGDDGRLYAWFPQGINPNKQKTTYG